MKPLSCLLPVLLLTGLAACVGESRMTLPELTAIGEEPVTRACASFFPKGRWQFIHSIEFILRDGPVSTVLGVTSIEGDNIDCALMTIEGFTLFTAVSGADGEANVRRAVPPFDKPGFAEGLLRDVRMIFLPPPSAKVLYGRLADNGPVCRYSGSEGRVTDIQPAADGCPRISSFTPDAVMDRSLYGHSCRKVGNILIPEYIELQGFIPRRYSLKMTLIDVENLNR